MDFLLQQEGRRGTRCEGVTVVERQMRRQADRETAKDREKEQLKPGRSPERGSLLGKVLWAVCGWWLLTPGPLINGSGGQASLSPGPLFGQPRCTTHSDHRKPPLSPLL